MQMQSPRWLIGIWSLAWQLLRGALSTHPANPASMLQSTNQFFLFALLWIIQYAAPSTTSPAYKYSTCTYTSCPVCTTACPTCLQPIPHQLRSLIPCHRLLRTPPRLCPATAASGKPTLPTSATLIWSRRRDVQPHPHQQLHQPLQPPAAPFIQRCSHGHSAFRPPSLPRSQTSRLRVLWRNPPIGSFKVKKFWPITQPINWYHYIFLSYI